MNLRRYSSFASCILVQLAFATAYAAEPSACPACDEWNLPHEPFRIYGGTYYVGTEGLSAILITSDEGHVLIDGALSESVPQIIANIETLGFRIEDVRLILNSHVHFDHAGGIAELQRLSDAEVAASAWSEQVLRTGNVTHDDPQFGIALPIEPVAHTRTIADGATLRIGSIALTAHLTPGHTPGGTSWTWESCEQARCLNIVYADSLTPVSADDFYFTRSTDYPNAMTDFEKSFTALEALPCDIFLTPHPGFADLSAKFERLQENADPNPFVDPDACSRYADAMREWLGRRVMEENTALGR